MATNNFNISSQPRGAVMGPFSKQPAAYVGNFGGPIGIFDSDGNPTETLAALSVALTALAQNNGKITDASRTTLTADAQVIMASIYDQLPPLIIKRAGAGAARTVKYTSLPLLVALVGKDKIGLAWAKREEPSAVSAGDADARANAESANDELIALKRVDIKLLNTDAAGGVDGGALTYGSSL